jgi:hypothetical protein
MRVWIREGYGNHDLIALDIEIGSGSDSRFLSQVGLLIHASGHKCDHTPPHDPS